MTIKVKHILLAMLIVVIAIILYRFLKEPVKEVLAKKKYERQIVSFLNLESFDGVSEGSIEEYEYYKNYYNEPDIDISPLIESYIKQVESNEKNPYNVGGNEVSLQSNLRRTIEALDYTYATYTFYGDNRVASISELEKILIHKSNNKYNDWYILKDSSGIIELPYNFYLEYEPSDFKLLDDVKKVTKCTFIDPVTYGNARKSIKVEYVDKNNKKIVLDDVVYISKHSKYKVGAFLAGLYYTEFHTAKIELKNHYNDMIMEEIERLHYMDNAGWDWDWEREDCKEIIETIKSRER